LQEDEETLDWWTGAINCRVNTDPRIGYGGEQQALDGILDEFRVYNRALSQEDVCYLCNLHRIKAGITCTGC